VSVVSDGDLKEDKHVDWCVFRLWPGICYTDSNYNPFSQVYTSFIRVSPLFTDYRVYPGI